MSHIIERLKENTDSSEAKSYTISLERGRIWAEDIADYFELREWSENDPEGLEAHDLPHEEGGYFLKLAGETPLEWEAYLEGWLDGVKEILGNR
ncbi:TPA: hypothetical protein EYP38_05165 [Candidatus Micrarchaeota archaeon]|nr:hypothetical protein [Candidatus Micrarchaeota archaeon]